MTTEHVSPRYVDLDLWDNIEALRALFEGQLAAVAAVGPALEAIAAAVEDAVPRLRRGGRLVYVGAGTSGRIGAQDGAELTPTFGWPRERVVLAMAGGEGALLRSVEGAEDSREAGVARMAEIGVGGDDVVLGLAASGATPFTVAALESARARGALTVGFANTADADLLRACERPVLFETGAEAIGGSTRLKAGTAQKVALNLFSTLLMVRLGRVYRGLMVDMKPTNAKLRARAARIVATIAGCAEERAAAALADAGGEVKLAVLLALGLAAGDARTLLAKHEGNLRAAIAEARGSKAIVK